MIKKLIITYLLFFVFILNSFPLFSNTADAELPTMSEDELYKIHILSRIDAADSPDYVKKFAYENDCFGVIKSYFWSYDLFKNNGGVYVCDKNGKAEFIYDYKNKLRFAKWYEKRKFKKPVFEF